MIDTFAISKTLARPTDECLLLNRGWKRCFSESSGKCFKYTLNEKDSFKPRLTLSERPDKWWNLRAEVSLGSWLYGSNLHLPDENEIKQGLDILSQFVENRSGIIFDARTERVTKVDFTRDFKVDENAVIKIIARFATYKLRNYRRLCFDETSVYFKNPGKAKTKHFLVYSKYHERLAKGKDALEQEAAKGIIRLENSYRKNGVNVLAKRFGLKSHHANYILTKQTSERVLEKAIEELNFANFITAETPDVEELFQKMGAAAALNRIGFLYMRDRYGEKFADLPFVNLSSKTLKRYQDDCNEVGICSLE